MARKNRTNPKSENKFRALAVQIAKLKGDDLDGMFDRFIADYVNENMDIVITAMEKAETSSAPLSPASTPSEVTESALN